MISVGYLGHCHSSRLVKFLVALGISIVAVGISNHSLIYAVRKFMLPKTNPGMREIRDYKHFDAELFIEDLPRMPWNATQQFNNPNTCWNVWKSFFTDTLNRHAPIQHKRTPRNSVPWITQRIKALMRNRDYHKKRAIKYATGRVSKNCEMK